MLLYVWPSPTQTCNKIMLYLQCHTKHTTKSTKKMHKTFDDDDDDDDDVHYVTYRRRSCNDVSFSRRKHFDTSGGTSRV